jgi:hypothetical protein
VSRHLLGRVFDRIVALHVETKEIERAPHVPDFPTGL